MPNGVGEGPSCTVASISGPATCSGHTSNINAEALCATEFRPRKPEKAATKIRKGNKAISDEKVINDALILKNKMLMVQVMQLSAKVKELEERIKSMEAQDEPKSDGEE